MPDIRTALVIGAGITGIAAAEWLRRDGVAVTVIDRTAPGDPNQTSFGNAGLLARSAVLPLSEPGMLLASARMVFDPNSPLFLRWTHLPRLAPWLLRFFGSGRHDRMMRGVDALTSIVTDAVDQHAALAAGTDAARFIQRGPYAYMFRNRAEYDRHRLDWDMRRRAGFRVTELEGAALAAHDANLSDRYGFAAMLEDHGWLGDPGAYVAALAGHFQDNGGKILTGDVTEIAAGRVTLADGQRFGADRIILATGAWSDALTRQRGLRTLVEPERGYHLFLTGPSFQPAHPFMVAEAHCVLTPMDKGLRVAGISEWGGFSRKKSPGPLDLLKKRLKQVYPTLTWKAEETWLGFRPTTPDSLPHIGSPKDDPSIICAFGAQHIGLTLGPRMGRLAADIATGRKPNLDLTPFRPDRFS